MENNNNELLFPGHCTSADREELEKIVARSMTMQKMVSKQKNAYWYPLSKPTYSVEEVMNVLDSLLLLETSMGRKVRDFENAFASWVGAKHAIMVNSGSTADLLCCFVCVSPGVAKLKPGDEVLIPALTWPTQIWSAHMAGLKVKLIDIDPCTLNTTPQMVEKAIGPKTKALFLVHLMGNMSNMDEILEICQRRNLLLLEDCCEALGARYKDKHVGTFGVAGAFSFFFSHHLVTMEGGMVITNDDQVADTLRVLRAHGWCREVVNKPAQVPGRDPRFHFVNWGFNVRPTELQGAFGQVQLKRLVKFNSSRNDKFNRLVDYLKKVPELSVPKALEDAQPCWMFVPITVKPNGYFTKGQLVAYLESKGVETRPVVVGDLKRQPAAEHFEFLRCGQHEGTEFIDDNAFIIGLQPELSFENLEKGVNDEDDIARLQGVLDEFLTSL